MQTKISLNMIAAVLCLLIVGAPFPSLAANGVADRLDLKKSVESAEKDPRAIIKEGFYRGIDKQRITLQNMKTYRETGYRLEEDYRILFNDAEIDLDQIPPDSIIRLIMIEGQIREIILLQRSS